jgi:hypothetical protein
MASPWYENKRFVSALLIAFFPAGLYGMWKSSQFCSRTKGIITGLFILPLMVGSFRVAYRESRFVRANASNSSKNFSEIERMGISYRQATQDLTELIPMDRGRPINGQDRYRGVSKDHTIALEIIGDKQAITEARMTIVPNSTADIAARNRVLLHRFLTNMVPEWPTCSDWADTTMDKISTFQDDTISAMRGYKKVTMTQMKASGTITVVVKHA